MPQLRSIQYLRGFAALLVVFFHAAHPSVGLAGEAGVDVFFVISGFVMWIATADRDIRPLTFLWQRIIRVVPLYWFFTLLLAAAAFVLPQAFSRLVLSGERLGMSLLFIPHVEPNSGKILPLLVQGWTLHYEMFFYLLVALSLLLPRWWRLASVFTVLSSLSLIGALFGRNSPAASVYLDPLLLEFAFGMLVGALWTLRRLPGSAASAVLAVVSFGVLLSSFAFADAAEHYRLLAWGLPGAGLVLGLLGLERAGWIGTWRLPAMIGDSSYSLYLTHTFVISVVGKIIERVGDPALKTAPATVVVIMAVSVAVGIVVYRVLELPLLKALRTKPGPAVVPNATRSA